MGQITIVKPMHLVCTIAVLLCQVDGFGGFSTGLSSLLISDHHVHRTGHRRSYYDFTQGWESPGRQKRSLGEGVEVTSLNIQSRLSARFSETWVESSVRNSDTDNRDVQFTVQIPELAFISNFSMFINNIMYIATVKEKHQARKEYEQAKLDNKTAGLVSKESHVPKPERGMEVFSVAVTVARNSTAVFTLTYQELLSRSLGKYQKRISVRPNQVVEKLTANMWLYEPQGFQYINVFEPSLDTNSLQNVFTTVTHVSDTVKHIVYEPSTEHQINSFSGHGIAGDLVLVYDVNHYFNAGETLYQDSYFVHYFSPDENQLTELDKMIIFVIDISGSMGGIKIEQTRDAMLTILDQLRAGDRFMLLLFSDGMKYWPSNTELVASREDTIASAKNFVIEKVQATGGTNINDALVKASDILAHSNSAGAKMIIFLTDGEPTTGVTSPLQIVKNVVNIASTGQVAIYSLAFGKSLDYLLLEMLSYRTGGSVTKIYVEKDASEQLKNFFQEVSTPVLLNLQFIFPELLVVERDLTKRSFSQYFQGSEVIIAGKLIHNPPIQWKLEVKANNFEMTKTVNGNLIFPSEATNALLENFMDKLFAFLKIKDLLYETKLTDDMVEKSLLEERALNLSLEYGLVTSLTSMIIVQNEDSDDRHLESAGFNPNTKMAHDVVLAADSNAPCAHQNNFFFMGIFVQLVVMYTR